MAKLTNDIPLAENEGWTPVTTTEAVAFVEMFSGYNVEWALAETAEDLAGYAGHPLHALPANSVSVRDIPEGYKVFARALEHPALLKVTAY